MRQKAEKNEGKGVRKGGVLKALNRRYEQLVFTVNICAAFNSKSMNSFP